VEKLERVLGAEEDARHALAQALDAAARIRVDALAECRTIESESAATAAAGAAADRERVLRAAGSASAALLEAAGHTRDGAVAAARGRLDAVAATIAAHLTGD
jgi:hypothetical protein